MSVVPCLDSLLVLIVIAVVVFFLRGRSTAPEPPGGALRIARERYARGEITKEEYEEIRRTLGG